MTISHDVVRGQVISALVDSGDLDVPRDANGFFAFVNTPTTDAKIHQRMAEVLPQKLAELGKDGWRLICYDAGENNYILVKN